MPARDRQPDSEKIGDLIVASNWLTFGPESFGDAVKRLGLYHDYGQNQSHNRDKDGPGSRSLRPARFGGRGLQTAIVAPWSTLSLRILQAFCRGLGRCSGQTDPVQAQYLSYWVTGCPAESETPQRGNPLALVNLGVAQFPHSFRPNSDHPAGRRCQYDHGSGESGHSRRVSVPSGIPPS